MGSTDAWIRKSDKGRVEAEMKWQLPEVSPNIAAGMLLSLARDHDILRSRLVQKHSCLDNDFLSNAADYFIEKLKSTIINTQY